MVIPSGKGIRMVIIMMILSFRPLMIMMSFSTIGGKSGMKKRNYFYFFFIVYIVLFILFFPKFIHYKWLENSDLILWKKIHSLFHNDFCGTQKYYRTMRNIMSEFLIPYSVIFNAGNMIFGFVNFKKKWWYYLMLIISVLFSILLIDCFIMYCYG